MLVQNGIAKEISFCICRTIIGTIGLSSSPRTWQPISFSRRLRKTNASFPSTFPGMFVCPEPVLVKSSFEHKQAQQRRVSHRKKAAFCVN
jgi:hypothetical protein